MVNKLSEKEVIRNVYPGVDVIPSDLSLTRIELPFCFIVGVTDIMPFKWSFACEFTFITHNLSSSYIIRH